MTEDHSGPLVSIGLPFRNAEATLLEAIRSVFAQSYRRWELILVDDRSTDKSLTIARSVDDPRVRVLAGERHAGLAARLNEIAQECRGVYLARMDADDLMFPIRISRQVEYMSERTTVDVLGAEMISFTAASGLLGVRGEPLPPRYSRADMLNGIQVLHPTVIADANWFRAHRYEPAYDRAEDLKLWCVAAPTTTFAVLPEPLHFYRESESIAIPKYVRSHLTTDRIIAEYGDAEFGPRKTTVLRTRNALRMVAGSLALASGRGKALARRRARPLDDAARASAQRALDTIALTRVPGVDYGPDPEWS